MALGKDYLAQQISLYQEIEAICSRKSLDIFYADFSKTFDKVLKNRLLMKLENPGIAGICNNSG